MLTPELKKGSAEFLILSLLAAEPRHGYELAQHREQQFQALCARGTGDEQARKILLAQLTDESLRDAVDGWTRMHRNAAPIPIGAGPDGARWLDTMWQDLRYGARSLWRSP